MTHFIVTANRLFDGGVAYLTADRRWSSGIDDAAVWSERAAADGEHGWARGQERVICDPYVVDVRLASGRPVPTSVRERIRAEGPLPTLQRLGYAHRAAYGAAGPRTEPLPRRAAG